jgi:hypothetical protein
MFADITMSARGHKVHMHLSIATSDVNKPVSIPQL